MQSGAWRHLHRPGLAIQALLSHHASGFPSLGPGVGESAKWHLEQGRWQSASLRLPRAPLGRERWGAGPADGRGPRYAPAHRLLSPLTSNLISADGGSVPATGRRREGVTLAPHQPCRGRSSPYFTHSLGERWRRSRGETFNSKCPDVSCHQRLRHMRAFFLGFCVLVFCKAPFLAERRE